MADDHFDKEIREEKTDADQNDLSSEAKKAEEYREKLLRLRAEFDNTRKRLEKDQMEAVKFANERLLVEILPIMDNLDRAVASLAEGHDPLKVRQGLEIAQKELHEVLEQHGVQVVQSNGELFDPHVHEAVAMVETEDTQEGHIVDEMQKGYLLNGRLLRPSRVRIAKKP